jgi:hypothetical protein
MMTTTLTLREQADSFEFRNALLRRAAWSEVGQRCDCSVPAAILLEVFARCCMIDLCDMRDLVTACKAEGMTHAEIVSACQELESTQAAWFYFCDTTGRAFMKTLYPMGAEYLIDASDAMPE